MCTVVVKVNSGVIEISPGKAVAPKLPTSQPEKKEVIHSADNLKNNTPPQGKAPAKGISFSTEPKKERSSLYKSVTEGAKISGIISGAEYFAAGAIVGFGVQSKFLNFIPDISKAVPKFIGVTNPVAKAAAIGLTAGAIGLTIGIAKGGAEGAIVNMTPSKGFAMAAMATTGALTAIPAFKINKAVGIIAVGANAAFGIYYGAHIFDKAKK